MEATKILEQEHRVIERVLSSLEAGANNLEIGENVEPDFFLKALDFFVDFIDGSHHMREERILYPQMTEFGIPVKDGPIGVMLSEHEMGRIFVRAIRRAVERMQNGDFQVTEELLENLRGYIDLLRGHIIKEDRVLFPIANRVIPAQVQAQILSDFELVDQEEICNGIQDKCFALVETLETIAGGFLC